MLFYFMLKAFFVLEIIAILYKLFGFVEKRLNKKAMIISKFITSQTGQRLITTHMLPNMSRNKIKYEKCFSSTIIQKMMR